MTGNLVGAFGRWPPRKIAFWSVRGLLLIWAGFWLWFNVASAVLENDGHLWHVALAAITVGLAIAGWIWPRAGGALMVSVAVLAAWGFHNWAAFATLTVPAAIIGLLLLLVPRPQDAIRPG